jgi:hypothetical protein
MGSLTIQIVGDASVGTKTKTFAIPDADVNRFVAWAQSAYPIITNGVASTPTVAQALASWANGIMAGTQNNVLAYERANAAAAPVAAVSPITAT